MNELIQDPTPVYLAIVFFALLSVAGVFICSAYLMNKEIANVKKNVGEDNYQFILKGK